MYTLFLHLVKSMPGQRIEINVMQFHHERGGLRGNEKQILERDKSGQYIDAVKELLTLEQISINLGPLVEQFPGCSSISR